MHGVWASDNCEYVRTGRYSLLFIRQDSGITSILSRIGSDTNIIGKATYNPQNKTCIAKVLDHESNEISFDIDTNNEIELKGIINESLTADEKLEISIDGDFSKTLTRIEEINITEPYEMQKANGENIAECLQTWGLGTVIAQEGELWSFSIGTHKHLYTFAVGKFSGGDVCYCRAARAKHLNKGTIFAQNIRLMQNPKEFTVRMQPSNIEVATAEVPVDESFFNPGTCTFGDQGIYWSLNSFSEDEIILNGCGGDEYKNDRPKLDSKDRVEWFK